MTSCKIAAEYSGFASRLTAPATLTQLCLPVHQFQLHQASYFSIFLTQLTTQGMLQLHVILRQCVTIHFAKLKVDKRSSERIRNYLVNSHGPRTQHQVIRAWLVQVHILYVCTTAVGQYRKLVFYLIILTLTVLKIPL